MLNKGEKAGTKERFIFIVFKKKRKFFGVWEFEWKKFFFSFSQSCYQVVSFSNKTYSNNVERPEIFLGDVFKMEIEKKL